MSSAADDEVNGPVKVIHIVGSDRSGSTLLANALGEVDGFFCAGELWRLWESLRHGRAKCGCDRDFTDCEVWSKVLDGLEDADSAPLDPDQVFGWQLATVQTRRVLKLLRSPPPGESSWAEFNSYASLLSRLYRGIADVVNARVIVDSSKLPSHAALVSRLEYVDAYALQVVRDPRAVAFSWQRTKVRPDRMDELPKYGTVGSTIRWTGRNAFSELVRLGRGFRRSSMVRYEDFVADPQSTLEDIISMVDQTPGVLPLAEGRSLKLGTNHTVLGNPNRFSKGLVPLKEDDEWQYQQGLGARFTATTLSAPLLLRYGYKVRTRT
jgi:hypothetical protein